MLGCNKFEKFKNKFKSFGWYVKSCDGHSFKDIDKNLKF